MQMYNIKVSDLLLVSATPAGIEQQLTLKLNAWFLKPPHVFESLVGLSKKDVWSHLCVSDLVCLVRGLRMFISSKCPVNTGATHWGIWL